MTVESDGETDVPIVCRECGTETRIPISDVASALEAHNTNRHDGEDIAQVDPELAAELADLVAEDMDLV